MFKILIDWIYRCSGALGIININNKPRDMKCFRKMSRYIMQQDVYQPMLTINEAMEYCADLKLGNKLSKSDKNEVVSILSYIHSFIYSFLSMQFCNNHPINFR